MCACARACMHTQVCLLIWLANINRQHMCSWASLCSIYSNKTVIWKQTDTVAVTEHNVMAYCNILYKSARSHAFIAWRSVKCREDVLARIFSKIQIYLCVCPVYPSRSHDSCLVIQSSSYELPKWIQLDVNIQQIVKKLNYNGYFVLSFKSIY